MSSASKLLTPQRAINYKGNYSSGSNYAVADAASYGGSTYVSLVASNHGNTPDQNSASWAVLVAQVCFASLALLSGVAVKYLRDDPKTRTIIDYWKAAVPQLGSTPVPGPDWSRPIIYAKGSVKVLVYLDTPALQTIAGPGVFRVKTTNAAQDIASVNVYLEQLKEAGIGLPALPGTSAATFGQTDDELWSTIDQSAISNDCRLSNTKILQGEPFKARLIGAAREQGLATHSAPDCTVAAFREKAASWRLAEVTAGKAPASAKQQTYNMTAAYDAFVLFAGAGDETRVKNVLLTPTFAEDLSRFGATCQATG